MARYRSKSPEDIAWNQCRRHLTRALDTAIQNKREIALDTLLTKAWEEFTTALQKGEVREIEARYANFASEIVADIVQAEEFSVAAEGR